MPFKLFGRSYPWLPRALEWLRPAANRAGCALLAWRLRRRYLAAPANSWPPARALIFDLRAWCRRNETPHRSAGFRCVEIFPARRLRMVPPRTIPSPRANGRALGYERQISLPPAFVVTLPGGRFEGRHEDVTTAAGEMLAELSLYRPETWYSEALRRYHQAPRQQAPQHLVGDAAVVASRDANLNYFHWLFNAVPRFELFRRAGLTPELANAYILTAPPQPYQAETLARLGVDAEKVVVCDPSQHVTADRLWATSSLRAAGQSSAWVADLLRALFLDDVPTGRLRLYVSRRDTNRRPMVNEAEIEDWLVGRGFQPVLPHGMTIREQAQLFAQADVVVAPNGAGLANLVFCPAGAKVFELFSPTWLGTYSWEVSNLRRLDYYYLIGEPARPHPDTNAYGIALTDLSRLMADAGL